MDEREKKLKELTANITQSMAKSTPVRTAKLAYVDSVAKPPRNVARKQVIYLWLKIIKWNNIVIISFVNVLFFTAVR